MLVDSTSPTTAAAVVNSASSLVKLTTAASATGKRPAQTGTASASVDASTLGLTADDKLDVQVGSAGAAPAAVGTTAGLNPVPTTAAGLAAALQASSAG